MNKKIIKIASVIAVGAGAAALYKGKFAKDNDSDSGSCGCKNSNGKDADKKSMTDKVIEKCPEFKGFLVPLCEYRGGVCTEFYPCGYNKTIKEKNNA